MKVSLFIGNIGVVVYFFSDCWNCLGEVWHFLGTSGDLSSSLCLKDYVFVFFGGESTL